MKLFKSKVLVVTLSVALITTTQISVATEQKNELYVTDDLLVDCNTTEPLYNADENVIAYYMQGEKGYAIIGVDGELIEFSEDFKIDEFDAADNDKSYYAGTGSYYVENEEDELKNVCSGEIVEKDDITNLDIESDEISKDVEDYVGVNVSNNKKSVTITYPKGIKDPKGKSTYTDTTYNNMKLQKYGSISHRTRYFYYSGGICGSIASSILVYYYYDHINNSYIKNDSYKGKTDNAQKSIVNHFKSLIGDDGKGTGYKKVKNGLNKYLKEIGKSQNCTYKKEGLLDGYFGIPTVADIIEKVIDNKKPCIVGLKGEPTYGDHWVVGGGYARYFSIIDSHNKKTTRFIKVNNGWYDNREKSIVYVNYKYVDGVIYFD